MMQTKRCTLLLVPTLALIALPAAAQSLRVLEPSPGYRRSDVRGISADGSVVVGNSYAPFNPNTRLDIDGFIERGSGPRLNLSATGRSASQLGTAGLSGDGRTAVGYTSTLDFSRRLATFSTADASITEYASVAQYGQDEINRSNFDGTVLTGGMSSNITLGDRQAFIIAGGQPATRLTPIDPFDDAVSAFGVSRDGRTIVGSSGGSFRLEVNAVVWTDAATVVELPNPSTMMGFDSAALGVSSNGEHIVGIVDTASILWSQGRAPLVLTGEIFEQSMMTYASHVSDDGRMILGARRLEGTSDSENQVYLWRAGMGAVLLKEFLRDRGAILPDSLFINSVTGVSEDFTKIAANGFVNGEFRGMVITVPGSGVLTSLVMVSALASHRRGRVR